MPSRLELLINLGLRGDTRVIGTEHPARGLTAHARHTDDGILDRVVGSVTHVELTGDVGGRNGDRAVAHASATLVVAAIEPLLQDLGLVLQTGRKPLAFLQSYLAPLLGEKSRFPFARSSPARTKAPPAPSARAESTKGKRDFSRASSTS